MWISRKQLAKERELERQQTLEIIREVTSGLRAQLGVVEQQLAGINQYFNFLMTDGTPTSRTLRDEDEWEMEQVRAKAAQRWEGDES